MAFEVSGCHPFKVGDFVEYEVNDVWYQGFISRATERRLFFRYDSSKYKMFEEPIDVGDDDDLERLRPSRASRRRGAEANAAAKPAAKPTAKPAAKPAAKKRARGAGAAVPASAKRAKKKKAETGDGAIRDRGGLEARMEADGWTVEKRARSSGTHRDSYFVPPASWACPPRSAKTLRSAAEVARTHYPAFVAARAATTTAPRAAAPAKKALARRPIQGATRAWLVNLTRESWPLIKERPLPTAPGARVDAEALLTPCGRDPSRRRPPLPRPSRLTPSA